MIDSSDVERWFQADVLVPHWKPGDALALDFGQGGAKAFAVDRVFFGSALEQTTSRLTMVLGGNGNHGKLRFRAKGAAPRSEPRIYCTSWSESSASLRPPPSAAMGLETPGGGEDFDGAAESLLSATEATVATPGGNARFLGGGALVLLLLLLLACALRQLGGDDRIPTAEPTVAYKRVYVDDPSGTEHMVSVYLDDDVDSLEALREAVAEAASEVVDDVPPPAALNLFMEDERGSLTRIGRSTPIRAALDCLALRVKLTTRPVAESVADS